MFYISAKNWNKILGYAEEAYETQKSEVGGMSVMVEDDDGDWELQQPVILQQEISSGNTVLDKEALAVYYTKQAGKMGKKNFRFCWWHSHHTMGAFWSGTDKTAIDEYSDGDFSFALVVNLKGEYKFRVSVWKPVEVHEDVDLEVQRPSRCNKNMSKEVENLCSKLSYNYSWKKPGNTVSYGYKSSDQVKDPRQGHLPFRTNTRHYTSDDLEMLSYNRSYSTKMLFQEIVEEIDDINQEAIDGSIDYKEYTVKVGVLNERLKQEKSCYEVTLIPEGKLSELLHMWPNQMVIYSSTKDEVYDDTFFLDGV